MSADLLREAAKVMRGRAYPATASPWKVRDAGRYSVGGRSTGRDIVHPYDTVAPHRVAHVEPWGGVADAEHIASWHPAVALAVADWLDREATLHESMEAMGDLLNLAAKELGAGEVRLQFSDAGDQMAASTMPQAVAVARTYLGRDA